MRLDDMSSSSKVIGCVVAGIYAFCIVFSLRVIIEDLWREG